MTQGPEARPNKISLGAPVTHPDVIKAMDEISPMGALNDLILGRIGSLFVPRRGPVGLTVLETLRAKEPEPTKLEELRAVTALPNSSLHQLLNSLQGDRYHHYEALIATWPAGGNYHITPVGIAILDGLHAFLGTTEVRILRDEIQRSYNENGFMFVLKRH